MSFPQYIKLSRRGVEKKRRCNLQRPAHIKQLFYTSTFVMSWPYPIAYPTSADGIIFFLIFIKSTTFGYLEPFFSSTIVATKVIQNMSWKPELSKPIRKLEMQYSEFEIQITNDKPSNKMYKYGQIQEQLVTTGKCPLLSC